MNTLTPTEFYINENQELALKLTALALDELELLVGRFGPQSSRKGLLRGKIVVTESGKVQIRRCFGNRLVWEVKP